MIEQAHDSSIARTNRSSRRRLSSLVLVSTLLSLSMSGSSLASVTISIVPATQNIPVGGMAVVDIRASGLGDFIAPSLGAFKLSLGYDPSILSASTVVFGNQLAFGIVGSVQTSDISVPGVVDIDEVSFEAPDDLADLQAGEFVLASISFTGIGPGISPLDLTINLLRDEDGDPFSEVVEAIDGSAEVLADDRVIPEPAAFVVWCLLCGTLLFGRAGLTAILHVDHPRV
jgi:hypothetical protein